MPSPPSSRAANNVGRGAPQGAPQTVLPGPAGTLSSMSDYVIPEPEPKPIDETLAMELQILASNAVLRGHPSGDERCDNCRYYLDETNDLSYCWHPKIRILVGGNWWCQWWEEIPAEG